jgi:hypothetical protein
VEENNCKDCGRKEVFLLSVLRKACLLTENTQEEYI